MGAFRSNAANFFPVRARVRSVMGRSYLEQLADFFSPFQLSFLDCSFSLDTILCSQMTFTNQADSWIY